MAARVEAQSVIVRMLPVRAFATMQLHCHVQEYLGITGNPNFNALSAKLAFGENSAVIKEARNATVQCLSGTGSLRVDVPMSMGL